MKRLSFIFFGGLLCAACVQAAQSSQSEHPRVKVDGHTVRFPDMQPRWMYNHTMVPIRGVFEHLHAKVMWDNASQHITCVSDDSTVELNLGDKQATVNGRSIHFDAPATLSHGRTLVPLRFLAQSLGSEVDWDDANQTVNITTRASHHHDR